MLMFGDYNIKDVMFGEDYKINYIYFGDSLIWERNASNTDDTKNLLLPDYVDVRVKYAMDTSSTYDTSALSAIYVNDVKQSDIGYINVTSSDIVDFQFNDRASIPDNFFSDKPIEYVIISSGITRIGMRAFAYCNDLTSITCQAATAPSIDSVSFRNIAENGTLYYPCGSDYSSWMSTSFGYLGSYGWTSECKNFGTTTVTARFYVDLTSSNELYILNENAISSVKSMKVNGTEIPVGTYISYPDTQTEYVVEYTLTDNTAIPTGFLSGITRCTAVTIPDSVTSIGDSAFTRCSNLTNINIPNSVTSIGDLAFGTCYGLTSITIPDSVTSIGESAFTYCQDLTSITCNAVIAPTIQKHTFQPVHKDGILYYPCGSDYSSWLSTDNFYLGFHRWTGECFENWQQMSKTMDKTIPFQTIRINTNGADASGWYFINFSTEPNQTINGATTQYSVAIEEDSLWDVGINHKISELTKIDEGVYEYTFSTPLYYAGCEENAQQSLISYLPL